MVKTIYNAFIIDFFLFYPLKVSYISVHVGTIFWNTFSVQFVGILEETILMIDS